MLRATIGTAGKAEKGTSANTAAAALKRTRVGRDIGGGWWRQRSPCDCRLCAHDCGTKSGGLPDKPIR